MSRAAWELRKDRAVQVFKLAEPSVKRDQLKMGCASNGRQKCVAPRVRSKRQDLRVRSPQHFDIRWFIHKADAWIAQDCVVQSPSFGQRYGVLLEHAGVGRQTQKPLLSQAAKKERIFRPFLEPCHGGRMVDVNIEGPGQPQIDVREKHLPRPGTPRCAVPSVAACRDAGSESKETSPVFSCLVGSPIHRPRKGSLPHLPVTEVRLRKPRRRYVLARELPCQNCGSLPSGIKPPSRNENR